MGKEGAAFAKDVVPLLKDPASDVRSSAVEALGQMGREGAAFAKDVVPLLKDPASGVRSSAVEALGQMGKEGAAFAKDVVPLLQDPDSGIRYRAVAALGQMGKEGAAFAKDLVPLLQDPDSDVRSSAVAALGQMGREGAAFAKDVVPLLQDPDSDVWEAAKYLCTAVENAVPPADYDFQVAMLAVPYDLSQPDVPKLRMVLRVAFGTNTEYQTSLTWLGRPGVHPMPTNGLSMEASRDLLAIFVALWDHTATYHALRRELSQRIGQVAKPMKPLRLPWAHALDAENERLLETCTAKLEGEAAYEVDRQTALDALARYRSGHTWNKAVLAISIHLGCWLLLLLAYPRFPIVQTFCFWNPWFRKFLGFPYVGLVLRWVPPARGRLFRPFADVLVADAQLERLAAEHWFPESTVLELDGCDPKRSVPLREAVPMLRGQVVLIGESGLGKTMFARQLVRQAVDAGRIVAFLPAGECGEGVLAALQKRLLGPARDEAFLRDLVYAGALDVCIDGLNQVPPDTRAKVADFMGQFSRGNILVTMQPMDWRPPKRKDTRRIRLEPLGEAQILAFLQSREAALDQNAPVRGDAFRARCAEWVKALQSQADWPQTRAVLSNPLDATVAAELIAAGLKPDLLDLRQQQYEAMAKDYRDECGITFPLLEVGEAAYEMRKQGREEFPADKFKREIKFMAEHRLLMRKFQRLDDSDKSPTEQWWAFRHDKFLEFFVVQAFRGPNRKRRDEHLGDPQFRGVYLRLALVLELRMASELREKLIQYAAATGDHSTSDEYVRLLARRTGTTTPGNDSGGPKAPQG
jgi:hypothetical protein